jgi:hypothetical protein
MKFAHKLVAASLMAAAASGAFAQKGETVKIALIEGLSGPFANVGQNQLRTWHLVGTHFSGAKNPAGVNFEIVGMDSKSRAGSAEPAQVGRRPGLSLRDAGQRLGRRRAAGRCGQAQRAQSGQGNRLHELCGGRPV